MKKAIYIGSLLPYTGKSIISLALAHLLKEQGKEVGYFKPFGKFPVLYGDTYVDQDVVIAKETLGLECDVKELSPVVLTQDLKLKALKGEIPSPFRKIKKAFNSVCVKKDFVIVGGSNFLADGAFLGISGYELIKKLNLHAVIVEKLDAELLVDPVLVTKERLKEKMIGVILNRVKPELMEYVDELIIPFLTRKGVEVLGVIPEEPVLAAITMREILESVGGRVVVGEEALDNLVERIMIGAMDVESALRHFRKVRNKVVITGGHRSDIILAALETSTKGIVVTGGVVPNELILSKAAERSVPVIVTDEDTFTIVDKIDSIFGKARISDPRRIQKGIELVKSRVNISKIIET